MAGRPVLGRFVGSKATTKVPITFAKPISRADVAKFLLEVTTDPRWDGPTGVQVTGA